MVSKMAAQESECFSLTDLFSGQPSIKMGDLFFLSPSLSWPLQRRSLLI